MPMHIIHKMYMQLTDACKPGVSPRVGPIFRPPGWTFRVNLPSRRMYRNIPIYRQYVV